MNFAEISALDIFGLSYSWLGSLVALAGSILVVVVAKFALLKIPAFAQTKTHNHEQNRTKYRNKKGYKDTVKVSQKTALLTNLAFFVFILPFIVTFEAQPVWKILLDVFLILMVYDFFYYLMHRFLFHGPTWFKQVHGVHHKARSITSLDALLLHPMEAFLGVTLFALTTLGLFFVVGPYHVVTIIITTVIYTQLNSLNHVHVDLPYFPFKTINWITDMHAVHHIDMQRGNFATITLLFDKLFGTLDYTGLDKAKEQK